MLHVYILAAIVLPAVIFSVGVIAFVVMQRKEEERRLAKREGETELMLPHPVGHTRVDAESGPGAQSGVARARAV